MTVCAVITGAAGALGGALARHLRKTTNLSLALLDSERHETRLQALAKELGMARAYAGDVAKSNSWRAWSAAIETELGPPQSAALIAGGWHGGRPFWEDTEDALVSQLTANLDTVSCAFRALLPGMVARKDGRIVVIGSRVVERPWTGKGSAAYTASKSAAVALAQAVAAETLEHGVVINAVLPSTMDTPANRAAMPDVDPATWVPLEAAAKQIAFLLSDDAKQTSGAAIPLYGKA